MKTALILFRSAESQNEGEYLDKIISIFTKNGFLINSVDMLSIDGEEVVDEVSKKTNKIKIFRQN